MSTGKQATPESPPVPRLTVLLRVRQVHQLLRHQDQSDGSHFGFVGSPSSRIQRRYGLVERPQSHGPPGCGRRFGTGRRRTVDVKRSQINHQATTFRPCCLLSDQRRGCACDKEETDEDTRPMKKKFVKDESCLTLLVHCDRSVAASSGIKPSGTPL